MEASVSKTLPARPNLDHLRSQAKTLLAQLKDGTPAAAQLFIDHLPEASRLTADAVRGAGYRLADAQSVVARQTGFASWPALSRHVQQLRSLEGDWRFVSLEIDGQTMPTEAIASGRLLIDGDRFRMESPEATYEGIFTIDVEAAPATIDIEFVEGPEAGNWCYGLYELSGDQLTFCLSLGGGSRPLAFTTSPGSGHALERLRRASADRPADVTGGTRQPKPAPPVEAIHPAEFEVPMTPFLRRLEGDWVPVQLVYDGKATADEWLAYGSRTAAGNHVKVVFGGQVMVNAKVRIDESTTPIAIDYLNLGPNANTISRGIVEFVGDDVRFSIAAPGHGRPADFSAPPSRGTLSEWRKKT